MINHTRQDRSAGCYRTQKTITYLYEFTRSIWLGRNDALHRDKETSGTLICCYSAESAESRHYHTNPQLIPTSHSHYCTNVTLDCIIQSRRPSVCRRWLRRVRNARAAFLRDGNVQISITKYLQPVPPQDCTIPVTLLPGDQTANIRVTTTQQRMTSFSPVALPTFTPLLRPEILRFLIETAEVGYLVSS